MSDGAYIVQHVADLWGFRMRESAAAAIARKFEGHTLTEICDALTAEFKEDPDSRRPVWDSVEKTLRRMRRRTYSAVLNDQCQEYRDWLANWTALCAKELIEVSERDPERIGIADWRAWAHTINDKLLRYKRDYPYAEWPVKDRDGKEHALVTRHTRLKITQERLKQEWTEDLKLCHQRARNLRVYGPETTGFKERWLARLADDGRKIGLAIEGGMAQEVIPF